MAPFEVATLEVAAFQVVTFKSMLDPLETFENVNAQIQVSPNVAIFG